MGVRDYISSTFDVLQENKIRWHGKDVEVDSPLPDSVNLKEVLKMVDVMMPSDVLDHVRSVKIGNYSKLNNRGVDAILDHSNNLLITNKQEDNYDLLRDIVHEMAHVIEEVMAGEIYSDDSIKREFSNKRRALRDRLEQHGYDTSDYDFMKLKYDKELDNFLWQEVGYDVVAQLAHDLFLSPYAATSLREYWADAFEDYYLKDKRDLKKYCPALYEKLEEVI